jgi:hypothetical protein
MTEKNFLANLLYVFRREVRPETKNETSRHRVVPVKQFIPRVGITASAADQQLSFGIHSPFDSMVKRFV